MAGVAKVPGPAAKRVATNVRALRRARGLSAPELSRRLAELGQPILDTGICKIEMGDRRVDVDDLVALAEALEVSVSDLLFGEVTVAMRVEGAQ